MYCKVQSHNWQLQLNQTGLAICVQVFDWSTTVRKVVVIAENTMSKSKTVLEVTAAVLDAPWETTTSLMHRSCNDGVIELSPLRLYAVLEVVDRVRLCMFCTPSVAVFLTHFSQLDLNRANLEATIEAEWILTFHFLRKRHFSMTSQWRYHYNSVVKEFIGHFTIF